MSSPPSCRILTVSSSTIQAKQLAKRIVTASSAAAAEGQSPAGFQESSTDVRQLPWTISNKYYTAPVHFSFAKTTEVAVEDAVEVPACIFVFSSTETFKDEFISLTSRLEDSDFEVSIAVSVPPSGVQSPTTDEQDALEEFFGEHGFEYVNGNPKYDPKQEHDVDDMEGVPGIARIVDALSTILWPSMVQRASSRRAKARSIVSVPGPPGEEEGLRSLLNAEKDTLENTPTRQLEMAALEKWLEEGADDEKDPWMGAVQATEADSNMSNPMHELSQPPGSGFDDNFSDFVSASAHVHTDTDNDTALPSQAEVEAMSQRILQLGVTEDVDEDDPQTPFDLSRVLAALEAMKEEIAGIANEDEKRKAAAKVALGLVYGLDEG